MWDKLECELIADRLPEPDKKRLLSAVKRLDDAKHKHFVLGEIIGLLSAFAGFFIANHIL